MVMRGASVGRSRSGAAAPSPGPGEQPGWQGDGGGPGDTPAAARVRRRPRVDGRLVLGVGLALVSMVVGARLVGGSGDATGVWSVRQSLAAGTQLRAEDLVVVRSDLGAAAGGYVLATVDLAGGVTNRALSAGELVPVAAVGEAEEGRFVSIPVESGHAPADLARGQRVDVYATYDADGAAPRTERILEGAVLQDVGQGGGSLTGVGAVSLLLAVRPSQVGAVVAAVRTARIDVARVVAAP